MGELTQSQRSILEWFALNGQIATTDHRCPRLSIMRRCINLGYIEQIFDGHAKYRITPAGRRALSDQGGGGDG